MIKNLPNKDFWRNKIVLVTGDSGFKGSWLVIWLSSLGANVYGLSLENSDPNSIFYCINNSHDSCIHTDLDIMDLVALKKYVKNIGPDIIIHLAAQAIVQKGYQCPLETWNINLIGSLNLLEAAQNLCKPCSVVMITTDKVYENQEWEYGYRETDRLGGRDPYSASKAGAEIAIDSWRKSFCHK